MPYLTDEMKQKLEDDVDVQSIWNYLSLYSVKDLLGIINYFTFGLIKRWIKVNGAKYWIFAGFIGTMVCCVLEVYRRLIAPYEDKAIKKNGDVK